MRRQQEEDARLDGWICGYVEALYHAAYRVHEKLSDEELKALSVSLIPGKLNSKDRRMEFAAHIQIRINAWRDGEDSDHRQFAGRMQRAFGEDFSDYISFGD